MLIAAALAVFAASCDYGTSPNTATRTTNHPTVRDDDVIGGPQAGVPEFFCVNRDFSDVRAVSQWTNVGDAEAKNHRSRLSVEALTR
jgi:hypothetical protein